MSSYQHLERRLQDREVILLDGAIGTQLQTMGVPIGTDAWAAVALESHPSTVRRMHENYIKAGVDVITVNTYASARQNLERIGLGDKTRELNLRAVMLAEDARDKLAKERPVLIAGSVSNYGMLAGAEPHWTDWPAVRRWSETSDDQARANLREQAEILAEAGVDFFVAESTGSTTQRKWVIEACASTGLPVWMGFRCRLNEAEDKALVGYRSEEGLAEQFDEVASLGGSVVTVFHSTTAATDAALSIVQEKWRGPIGVYPEADRPDYVQRYRDHTVETRITPDEFVRWSLGCVERGVQIVGGCCGIELEYIRPLREALPSHVPDAVSG
jgi:S-methylmethionine-dependent homocysteine/selenocysteine methylase